MSDDVELVGRISRLNAEIKKTLPFAAELEAIMVNRRAAYVRPDWLRIGPRFGKPHPFSADADFGAATMRAYCLLSDCAALVSAANLQGNDDHEARRSFMLACRILGLPWAHIEKALADVSNFSTSEAADAWARYLGPTDQKIVGSVYVACTAARPDIIKIGFSRNPVGRAKSLSRVHGVPIDIIHQERGTMLHEWAIHQLLFRVSVAPEWYRADDVPAWLFPIHRSDSEREPV